MTTRTTSNASFVCGCLVILVAVAAVKSGTAGERSYIARGGQPEAAIVIGAAAGDSDRFAAAELARFIQKLTLAKVPVTTADRIPDSGALIVVGGPASNTLSARAAENGSAKFGNLKSDGYILKSVDIDGRPALLAAGADDAGTLYAVYGLLERLGIVFQPTQDIVPQARPDLPMPEMDERSEPVVEARGLMVEHAFGSWYMNESDYEALIDQMAKMRMNTLQFTFGMGSPFLKFSYRGRVGELLTTPETHYTAWGSTSRSWGKSPHTTTASARDVRVGRELFPDDFVGGSDFANVHTPEQAFDAAREFLRCLIRHAHQRHVKVTLLPQELSFVPPNLAEVTAEVKNKDEYMFQRYCGVALSPANPDTLAIWEAAMMALIAEYPEADAYGFWTTEHSPEMNDPRIQEILRDNAAERALLPSVAEIRRRGNVIVGGSMNAPEKEQLDADFLQLYLASELVKRVRQHRPDVPLVVMTLFRGYKLPVLDAMLPKDVWIGNMEECATTKSVMDFYAGMPGRKRIVMPRLTDDGDELHMQLNATEYDDDEIVSGAARYRLAGIVGQLIHPRNAEYNIKYIADGGWNASIQPRPFYEDLLARTYGSGALKRVLDGFLRLEACEKRMVYWGRSEICMAFNDRTPILQIRTNVDYRTDPPTVMERGAKRVDEAANESGINLTRKLDREELVRSINATWGDGGFWKWRKAIAPQHAEDVAMTEGDFYRSRAGDCRKALASLIEARNAALPGSRSELEYVIGKTQGFIAYLDVLAACQDARVELDRAWLGLVDGNRSDFRRWLLQSSESLERAHRLAISEAGRMIAYADEPTERYLLVRFNRNILGQIENARQYVDGVVAFQQSPQR